MNADELNAVAAAASAVAAVSALVVALVSMRASQRLAAEVRRRDAHSLDSQVQARLEPLYPGLRAVLGHLEDGVPKEIRSVLIPFFVLYSDAFAAHRDGLLNDRDWRGLQCELAYWAQKPIARRAWAAFQQQEWSDGFADHIAAVHCGPPAYPHLQEVPGGHPSIHWPEAPEQTVTEFSPLADSRRHSSH